jgi:DNA repair exonuclease SbcCD ATPase subunit
MERPEFTNLAEPWWLLQPEGVDNRIELAREQLATNLGWDRFWFKQQIDVDKLFDVIKPTHEKLFYDLDYLTNLEEQVRWLDKLVEDTKPETESAAKRQQQVEAAVDQAISHLSSDASNEIAQQLNVQADEIAALTDNAEFKEILREVLENRMSATNT